MVFNVNLGILVAGHWSPKKTKTMKRLLIGSDISKFDELDSTNSYLADLSKEKEIQDGSVVVAGYQTAGRGQDTNTWYSSAEKNLLLSIFLRTGFIKTEHQFLLNKFVSLGILDYIKRIIDNDDYPAKIKWPNDIYIGNKKVAGILIQNQIQGTYMEHTIIGIGLNINEDYFPSDIPNPVSIKQIINTETDLNECLEKLLDAMDIRYQQMFYRTDASLHSDYQQSLFRFNEKHNYRIGNEIRPGSIIGINEFGRLIIEFNEGNRDFDMKEVEFLFDDQE